MLHESLVLSLFERGLLGKLVSTFPDHALIAIAEGVGQADLPDVEVCTDLSCSGVAVRKCEAVRARRGRLRAADAGLGASPRQVQVAILAA